MTTIAKASAQRTQYINRSLPEHQLKRLYIQYLLPLEVAHWSQNVEPKQMAH